MTSLFFIDEQPVCFFGKSQSESLNFACPKSVREDSREGGRFNFPNPECSFGKGGLQPLQCPRVRMPQQLLLDRMRNYDASPELSLDQIQAVKACQARQRRRVTDHAHIAGRRLTPHPCNVSQCSFVRVQPRRNDGPDWQVPPPCQERANPGHIDSVQAPNATDPAAPGAAAESLR